MGGVLNGFAGQSNVSNGQVEDCWSAKQILALFVVIER